MQILDSLIRAFSNRDASLVFFKKCNEKNKSIEAVEYDGKWFKRYIYDVCKVTLSPSNNQEITIYDLVNAEKSFRDLVIYLLEERPFYNSTSEELWKKCG